MTDHAKALADALRDLIDAISHSDFGYEDFIIASKVRGDKALAAHDARPQEPDTKDCPKCGWKLNGPDFNCPFCNTPPITRPQASGDLVERLRDIENHDWRVSHLAHDALSRPPQPDTVTEEMVDAAMKGFDPLNRGFAADKHSMRAALTAALEISKKT